MKLAARSIALGAFAALAVALPLLAGASGCDVQELQAQPDAALSQCDPGPFVFCEPTTADQPHCSSDDTSSPYLTRLPRATSYPVGCTINYVGERDQVGSDCKLEQVCRCVLSGLDVPADAGNDANAEDAGVAAPAPTPTGTPVWQCQ